MELTSELNEFTELLLKLRDKLKPLNVEFPMISYKIENQGIKDEQDIDQVLKNYIKEELIEDLGISLMDFRYYDTESTSEHDDFPKPYVFLIINEYLYL